VLTDGGSLSLETDIEFKNEAALGDPILVPYFKALDAGGNIFAGYEMAAGIFCLCGNTTILWHRIRLQKKVTFPPNSCGHSTMHFS
jgi:hypothetical protein